MSKLIDVYRSLLGFCGYEADDDGLISKMKISAEAKSDPVITNGKRLVLPTQQMLRSADIGNKIVFNPLRENALKGESDIIKIMRYNINVKLSYSLNVIMLSLLHLAASPRKHKTLSPDQTEFLLGIKSADETTVRNFSSVMQKEISDRPDRFLVSIYLKRGGIVNEKKYARAGIVSFPFYEELVSDKKPDKLRVKDVEAITSVFKYVLPEVDDKEAYNYGTNSSVAPYCDALMMTAAKIAGRINDVVELFKDHIDDWEKITFPCDWYDAFLDLDGLVTEIRRIPEQPSNAGETTVAVPPTPVNPAPVAPARSAAPAYNGYQSAPPPAPYQQTQPQIVNTGSGIDFHSLKAARPDLVQPSYRGHYNQPANAFNNRPRWDRGPAPYPQNNGYRNDYYQPEPPSQPYYPSNSKGGV